MSTVRENPNRKAIHAYLSDEAHDTWHELAEEGGVSVSGLLEVLPGFLSNGGVKDWQKIVVAARKVDALRRRR